MLHRSLPQLVAACLATALPAMAASMLGACSGGPRASLVIEVAPVAACTMPSEAFEGTWDCLRIQICPSPPLEGAAIDAGSGADAGPRDAGTSTGSGCVEVTTPGGDHESADDELLIGRASQVTFDARVEPGRRYDVSVTVYDDAGDPVATGRTRYADVSSGGLRVRLHRFGRSSCAGVGPGDALPAHRAFGAAVALPDGDVLYLGGITGDRLGAAQLSALSRFQRQVQVYDASEGRFHDVAVQDATLPDNPAGGFARVLFEARRIGTEPDGRQRIRIFGGFGSTNPTALAARFDQSLRYTVYGMPIAPSADSDIRRVVDMLYDPVQRTATIDLAATMVETVATGGAAVSEVVGGTVVTVGGLTGTGGPTMLVDLLDPTVSGLFQVWNAEALVGRFEIGGETTMDAQRYGATVTHLSGSSYLVWGGAVSVSDVASIRTHAGAHIDVSLPNDSTLIDAPEGGSLPTPVAFHTATGLAPNHVLVVGGMTIGGAVPMAPTARLEPAAAAFSILVDEAGALRGVGVSGDPRPATILHQATVIAESGGVPTAVLLTGGAVSRLEPSISASVTTMWATAEVGVLTGSNDSWSYRVLPTAMQMRFPRFGHTTTVIPGVGVLVSGGYRSELGTMPPATVLIPVQESELFLVEDLLGLPLPPSVECDAGPATDGGRRDAGVDAGAADAPVEDAPVEDAPVEMTDAPI